jgi:hypothetical protein
MSLSHAVKTASQDVGAHLALCRTPTERRNVVRVWLGVWACEAMAELTLRERLYFAWRLGLGKGK